MRYLSLWKPTEITPPSPAMIEQMTAFMTEAIQAGVLVATEGFGPSSKNDLKVRGRRGDYTVTDGPFSEAKELIGGFAILQVSSRDELLAWTRRFMDICGEGECEIHQLSEVSPIDQMKSVARSST